MGVPVQETVLGVTVTVATTVALVTFAAVKAAIFPLPLAAKPMLVVVFVQLNVVLPTEPLKETKVVEIPPQIVWLEGCVTSGVEFIMTTDEPDMVTLQEVVALVANTV